ncbi:hypothetical protein PSTG_19354, partial [Puccinia striiformis f. sp. tritici PST-78]
RVTPPILRTRQLLKSHLNPNCHLTNDAKSLHCHPHRAFLRRDPVHRLQRNWLRKHKFLAPFSWHCPQTLLSDVPLTRACPHHLLSIATARLAQLYKASRRRLPLSVGRTSNSFRPIS